jgi:outer membrane receptor protein involved in Fe transport
LVTYPKASATWVVSEEPFWSFPFLNSLRLRAAWGKSGQQPQTFAALRTFSPVTGPGDEPVGTPNAPGNPDLAPEDGEELELGFDAELFGGRASVEFTYFNQNIEDALLRRQTAPSGGFIGNQWVNAGEISNTGFEVLVDGLVLDTRPVDWNVTANVATVDNEIEELGIEGREFLSLNNNGRHAEGFPVSSWFMNHVVSAERNDAGEIVNVMCEAEGRGDPVPCSQEGVYSGLVETRYREGVLPRCTKASKPFTDEEPLLWILNIA